jgi:hypothetical protein
MCLGDLFSIGEASGLPEALTVNRDDIADSFQPIQRHEPCLLRVEG